MVAERPLVAERLGGVDEALDHDVGVGRNLEVVGFALHHLDRLAAEIAGEQEFIQPVRQRRGGAKRKHRVAAEEDGHRHPLAGFVVAASVARGDFLQLPMHAGGRVVVNLHAIHAEVAVAGVGVARDDAGQRDEASAVERPALEDRQVKQRRGLRVESRGVVDVGCAWPRLGSRGRGVEAMNNFLARAGLGALGLGVAQGQRLAKQRDGFADAGGRLGLDE